MAKRKIKEERLITRKETVIRRRDAQRNRRVMIGLAAVTALIVILIGAGVIQELILKPRQPVATVNNATVSLTDFQKRVRFNWYQSGNEVTDAEGTSLDVLDQMIDEKLIREQAQQQGIAVSADEVTEAIEQSFSYYRNTPTPAPTALPEATPTPGGSPTPTPYPTSTPVSLAAFQQAYQNYLSQVKTNTGMSEADFRTLVETDLLRSKLYEVVSKDVPTTEEQVHARHILVSIRTPEPTPTPLPAGQATPTPDPSATPTLAPRTEAQAFARITEVQLKLAAGADFAALAQEYSDDTGSAVDGGDLGWFGKGQMVSEFETAAFDLQPGQVSAPVKTDFGYHLIKVEERDPARAIDEYTLMQNKYTAYTKWLSDLRTAAKIQQNWAVEKVPATPSVPLQTSG